MSDYGTRGVEWGGGGSEVFGHNRKIAHNKNIIVGKISEQEKLGLTAVCVFAVVLSYPVNVRGDRLER